MTAPSDTSAITVPVSTARHGSARSGDASRVPRLDGVRGLLALAVVMYHVAFTAGVSSFILQPGDGVWGVLIDSLTVCVPPFLVLSGLLLYRSYARAAITGGHGPSAGAFMWRRALRIIPAYWAMTIATLLVIDANGIRTPWDVLRPLLMLQFFWPNGPFTGFEHTWTIPADVAFYLVLPLVALIIARYVRGGVGPAARARRMILPLTVFGLIGFAYTVYMFLPSMLSQAGVLSWWPPRYAGFYALGMAMGALAAYVEATGTKPAVYRFVVGHPILCWLGALVLCLVNGITKVGNHATIGDQIAWYLLVMAFAVLLIGPVTAPEVRSRFLDVVTKNRPIRFIGQISYGIYLWHLFFIYLWLKDASVFRHTVVDDAALRGTVSFWPTYAFVLGCTIAVAALSHYLLERPVMRLKRLVPSRAPAPSPVEQAELVSR
jgi:peptidoglycan/LPS O-acetylase OafA/YrhL